MIASLFFSIINALVKFLGDIPALEIVFFRSVVSLIISYISLAQLKIKIFNEHTPLLFARGLSGAIALSLYFYTIQHMPLATAVTVLYLAPIFTVILAIFLVKEHPGKWQYPFFILSFIGAALMKNFDPRASLPHFFMGVTAAFFAGLAYNFIRMLKDKCHHSLVIFYFPMVTIPFCLPFLFKIWVTPSTKQLIILLSIGLFTQLAQIFMTKAYMLENASRISHYNYLTSLYAFITGIIFFNESINYLSVIGMILVFVGVIFSHKFAPKKLQNS